LKLPTQQVVVKPLESAGSDDVYLCQSVDEVRQAFDTINGKVNGLGSVNEGALVQEYLDGTEYVIDSVSRDGVHKVVAIWEYDKRSVNGANFVYFGMKLNAASGEKEQQLCDYALTVLDAMGVVHGPGHMEVKVRISNLAVSQRLYQFLYCCYGIV
jgi:biotin carboxylase